VTIDLPAALTPAIAVVGVFVATGSRHALTGVVPAVVAALSAVVADALWRRRGKRWHDAAVIVALLPALAGGLWIGLGGTLLHVHRGEAGRLLLEIGPGLALTGLATTLISYHGRHRP
jgi:drug/metabolite transporter (DMT)-like permease